MPLHGCSQTSAGLGFPSSRNTVHNTVIMKTAERTTQAPDTVQMVNEAVRRTDKLALDEAARTEARVTDMRGMQTKHLQDMFEGHSDGGFTMEDMQPAAADTAPDAWQEENRAAERAGQTRKSTGQALPRQPTREEVLKQALAKASATADKREARTSAVKDAKVMKEKGNIAGLQKDGSKQILLSESILQGGGSDLTTKVTKHELRHREQEDGDASFALPPTGNPTLDKHRNGIRRLMFREKDSMDAEGGIHANTSGKYVEEYWKPVEAIKSELNKRGENGDQLALQAARTQEGFRTMHRKLMTSVMQEQAAKDKAGWKPEYALKA